MRSRLCSQPPRASRAAFDPEPRAGGSDRIERDRETERASSRVSMRVRRRERQREGSISREMEYLATSLYAGSAFSVSSTRWSIFFICDSLAATFLFLFHFGDLPVWSASKDCVAELGDPLGGGLSAGQSGGAPSSGGGAPPRDCRLGSLAAAAMCLLRPVAGNRGNV